MIATRKCGSQAIGHAAKDERQGFAVRLVAAVRTRWQAARGSVWMPVAGRALGWLVLFLALAHVGSGAAGRLLGAQAALSPTPAVAALLDADLTRAGRGGATRIAACALRDAGAPRSDDAGGATDAAGPPPVTEDGRVVLNLAGKADLDRLPGIGEKRAQAIIALRHKLGRFRRPSDLLRIRGIGRRVLARIEPLVVVDAPSEPDAGAGAARDAGR
ncbi:MAG: helix-hairpin-helix domain-containing protein [Deltaproteobacteria bacterium]|nr:helix-hairpin-helix domain-containing protein [Deltaproteobacteria bacterium]